MLIELFNKFTNIVLYIIFIIEHITQSSDVKDSTNISHWFFDFCNDDDEDVFDDYCVFLDEYDWEEETKDR